ncbi:MAG: hypothetical protein WB559_05960 [Candidatus Acidiferrales bacterium]
MPADGAATMRGSAGAETGAGVAVSLPPAATGVSVADCAAQDDTQKRNAAAEHAANPIRNTRS